VYTYAEAQLYQAFEDRELDKILAGHGSNGHLRNGTGECDSPRLALCRGAPSPQASTVGRIEIPRLGVSSVIRAGSDARSLRLAVGYIPGTALPAIAATSD
jgi:sortase (surface protein transpeptidase)